jgi:hypothetical protein
MQQTHSMLSSQSEALIEKKINMVQLPSLTSRS